MIHGVTPAASSTVSDLMANLLEAQRASSAFGVISLHNMPMLDAIGRRDRVRYVSQPGRGGAPVLRSPRPLDHSPLNLANS